jgi:hypothetical protein
VTTIFRNLSPENKALNPKSQIPPAQPRATIIPGKQEFDHMSSAKQVLAAQTNGRKSQGPKTAEGRRKSSANSRKHGLYGKDIQTDDACEAYRQSLLAALLAKYQTADPTERGLVETIALAGARQDWAIRTSETYFAQAIEAQANPEAPYKHPGRSVLLLLHRLENRYFRLEMRARESLQKISEMKERTHSTHAESEKCRNEPDSLPAKMQERTVSRPRPHRGAVNRRKSQSINRRFNLAKSSPPTPGMLRWA